MTAITFEARLLEDGSLSLPKEAADKLGLHPGDTVEVQVTATASEVTEGAEQSEPSALNAAVHAMTHRTPEQLAQAQQRAMELYVPRRTPPPGKTLSDMVSGKWPGDETEEQITQALAELS